MICSFAITNKSRDVVFIMLEKLMEKPSDFMDTRTRAFRDSRKQLINTKINIHANDFSDEKRIKFINSSLNHGLIKENLLKSVSQAASP